MVKKLRNSKFLVGALVLPLLFMGLIADRNYSINSKDGSGGVLPERQATTIHETEESPVPVVTEQRPTSAVTQTLNASAIELLTKKLCYGDGLLLIPEKKIALCLLPKIATTTWKFLAMRLLGGHPKDICGCTNEEWGCLKGNINNHKHELWKGATWARNIDVEELNNIMTGQDRKWTSIAMVREPWKRSISAFWEDNLYHLQPLNFLDPTQNKTSLLRKRFVEYLAIEHDTCHSHSMVDFCGLSKLDYDHVFDLDDGFKGLETVLGNEPLMTTGWEICMQNNKSSFFDGRIDSSHHGVGNSSFWMNQFCSNETSKLVHDKYSRDFDLYEKLGKKGVTDNTGCVRA